MLGDVEPASSVKLGTALDIMDRAMSQITAAADLETKITDAEEENRDLLKEKVKDQQTVIQLQEKLLQKHEEQIQEVKSTVQKEVKSYASVVQRSCASALAPKKLETVVRRTRELEDRERNVIIHGLAECDGEDLKSKVGEVFSKLDKKPFFTVPCRIGTVRDNTPRPVKVSFPSANVVGDVLRNSCRLRSVQGFETVYISPDMTRDQRVARKNLVTELKTKRNNNPELKFFIKSGKIVSESREV